tara:strand:- start:318 stop:710 length:393 start_codon:yes stop_codon:yes gene_type:complete
MKKIKPNSIDAVIFFALYICAQDSLIAEEEIEQIDIDFPMIQKLYFDIYGEFIEEDLKELIKEVSLNLLLKNKFINKNVSKLERETFSNLLSDPKLQDISLLFARHAASADGFHTLEEKKFNYWAKKWGL